MNCPNCDTTLHTRAVVKAWGKPDGWQFYGEQGKRWIVCDVVINNTRHVHFRHQAQRGMIQALAIVKGEDNND